MSFKFLTLSPHLRVSKTFLLSIFRWFHFYFFSYISNALSRQRLTEEKNKLNSELLIEADMAVHPNQSNWKTDTPASPWHEKSHIHHAETSEIFFPFVDTT